MKRQTWCFVINIEIDLQLMQLRPVKSVLMLGVEVCGLFPYVVICNLNFVSCIEILHTK